METENQNVESNDDTVNLETEFVSNDDPKKEDSDAETKAKTELETVPEKDTVDHWKKFARKHEDEVKVLKAEKAGWEKLSAEYEKKVNTLSAKLTETEAKLGEVTLSGLRAKTAYEFKISEEYATEFLTATTEEGLRSQAEKLAAISAPATFEKKSPVIKTQGQQTAPSNDPRQAILDWQKTALKK